MKELLIHFPITSIILFVISIAFIIVLPTFILFQIFKPKRYDITREIAKQIQREINEKQLTGRSRVIKMDEHFSWEPKRSNIRQLVAIYDGYLIVETFSGRVPHSESNLYKLNREFIEVWHCDHPKGFFFSHIESEKGVVLVFDNDKKVWKLDTDTGHVEPWEIHVYRGGGSLIDDALIQAKP